MRLPALLVGCALAAGLPAPAQAATAGQQRYLAATVEVGTPAYRYAIDVVASDAGTGQGFASRLEVTVTRCAAGGRCRKLAEAVQLLPAGAVTVDSSLSSARLSTSLSGVPLTLSLQHTAATTSSVYHPGFAVYPLETTSGGPNARADVEQLGSGPFSLGRSSCPVEGTIGVRLREDRVGEEERQRTTKPVRLSASDVAALRSSRC